MNIAKELENEVIKIVGKLEATLVYIKAAIIDEVKGLHSARVKYIQDGKTVTVNVEGKKEDLQRLIEQKVSTTIPPKPAAPKEPATPKVAPVNNTPKPTPAAPTAPVVEKSSADNQK